MCLSLFELSILYLLHNASKLTGDPGNLSLAKTRVSTISLFIFFFPKIAYSLFKWLKSNSALWIISLLSLMNSKNLSATSKNFFCVPRNSSV